jgi:magnesium-transporting ATPase (P-type)
MITGDKRETAINIAVSCRLLKSESEAMLCEASSPEEAAAVLARLLRGEGERPDGSGAATTRNSRVLARAPTHANKGTAACRPAVRKPCFLQTNPKDNSANDD